MTEALRPHVGIASAHIVDIVARPGGYAVLTSSGVDLFDDTLSTRTTVASEGLAGRLEVLADGRFLVHASSLHASVDGKPFEPIETGKFLRDVVVTERGFIAIGSDQIVFDRGGQRTELEVPDELLHGGAVAWRGGVAVAGRAGLLLVDADGHQVARSEPSESIWLTDEPILAGAYIVAKGLHAVHVFDDTAREVARIERDVASLTAFDGGVLACESDRDTDTHTFTSWRFDDGAQPQELWQIESRAWAMYAVGERLVLRREDDVQILDRDGDVLATVPCEGYVREALPFGDGILIRGKQLVWWRAGEPPQILEHDVEPGVARVVPVGIASSEHDILYLWRPDVQGPARTTLASDLPFGVPLVIDGTLCTIESAAQFSLRAKTPHGFTIAIRPEGRWRHAATRAEALRICERLVGRTFDGPLPEIGEDTNLAQLPLDQTVDLFGRSMFAEASLDEAIRPRVAKARDAFVHELAAALGKPARVVLASLRARKVALVPPRPVDGYDYLGTFAASTTLIVADPCHIERATPPSDSGIQIAVKLDDAAEGIWHVFARSVKDSSGHDRTAELVVVHERGFGTYAGELIGSVGVDAGCVGVFDKACPKRDLDRRLEEGVQSGLGAMTWSGYGDGMYPVFAGRHAGEIAKIRIPYIDDEPEVDRLVAKAPDATTKPYRASTTFVAGDTVEHPKFGTGSVVRVGADNKIDVRFADGTRTLVHRRA